jgi:hypothetical protein
MQLAAPSAAAAAPTEALAATGYDVVNTTDREEVKAFWQLRNETEGLPMDWTGDVASCNPGTISPAYADAMIAHINWYRVRWACWFGRFPHPT